MRYMIRQFSLSLLVLFAGMLLPRLSLAQPATGRILNYHSDVTLNRDSSLSIQDTIVFRNDDTEDPVNGLFRFFPTRYPLGYGLYRTTPLSITSVASSTGVIPFQTYQKPGGQLLEIGNDNSRIPRGAPATFIITYHTERQLDYFPDHSELYWHVTGSGWEFPIDQASVTLTLPAGLDPAKVTVTGALRHHGMEASLGAASIDATGKLTLQSMRGLSPHEGLNLLVKIPNGFFPPPTPAEERMNIVHDNPALTNGLFFIIMLFVIYSVMWLFIGKDPRPGTISPKIMPPSSLSPAGLRYLWIERYDPKTFMVALVDLAINGMIHIQELEDRYIFRPRGDKTKSIKDQLAELEKTRGKPLPFEEENVAHIMFATNDHFILQYDNATTITAMVNKMETSLKLKCENVFLSHNGWFLGIGMGIANILLIILACREVPDIYMGERIRLILGVVVFGVGLPLLPFLIYRMWHDIFSHYVGRIGNSGLMKRYAFFVFLFLLIGAILVWNASSQLLLILLLMSLVNMLFASLLKAPTRLGRKILDEAEGFRMFLSGEHPALIAQLNPPPHTAELFEQYLPYALALDMEQQWAAQFRDIFIDRTKDNSHISQWYSGPAWALFNPHTLAVSLTEELALSLTPITVPMDALPETSNQ